MAAAAMNLAALVGNGGLVFNGEAADDASGASVSVADVNGDGLGDILIGAYGNNYYTGKTYLIFGKRDNWNASIFLGALNGSDGLVFNGEASYDQSGFSVSGADVNGDGFADILIGANRIFNSYAGKTYLIFGKKDNWNASVSLEALNSSDGLVFYGEASNDECGFSVSSAADVNGDGLSDFLIGAYGANRNAGKTYLIFGKRDNWNATVSLGALNGSDGLVFNGEAADDYSARWLSGADVNGDGLADILIGAYGANSSAGKTYLIFGKRDNWNASVSLGALNGSDGLVFNGEASLDNSGCAGAVADVNGDGLADILIGACGKTGNNYAGKTYLIFGKRDNWNATVSLGALNGSDGLVFNGEASGDKSGYSVSVADVNGDGLGDILIGAYGANSNTGRTYVVFGKRDNWSASMSLAALSSSDGLVFYGEAPNDKSGSSVSGASDVNGDGLADVLIGAYGANSNAGKAYLIFGYAPACPAPDYVGQPGFCSCGSGFCGDVYYRNNQSLGCFAPTCSGPGYIGTAANCSCASGYAGAVVWTNCTPSGCAFEGGASATMTLRYSSAAPQISGTVAGVRVTIPQDPEFGSNGTVVVVVNPPTPQTVSKIVSIDFYDSLNNTKNITNLTQSVVFDIPLLPGAADPVQACLGTQPAFVTPACNWYDPVRGTWNTSGCVTTLLPTQITCSCTHLTDFAAVVPRANRVPLKQVLNLTPANIALFPDGIITVMVVVGVFLVVLAMSIYRDHREKQLGGELETKKFEKWTTVSNSLEKMSAKMKWFLEYKTALQLRHTWASVLFRKPGSSFRSVDRALTILFLVLASMCISARFHAKNKTFMARGEIMVISAIGSFFPTLLLTYLFTHTGELGFYEKYQMQQNVIKPSRFRVFRYRFPERWRYVWYIAVIGCAAGMIVYILSIALMFDQNPYYYCRDESTKAWIIDFIVPYIFNVFVAEPLKIMLFMTSKVCLRGGFQGERSRPDKAEYQNEKSVQATEISTLPSQTLHEEDQAM